MRLEHISAGEGAKFAEAVNSFSAARGHYEDALELLEGEEDLRQRGEVLNKLGMIVGDMADWEALRRYGEEALEIYERLGDEPNMTLPHFHLRRAFAGGGALDAEKALEHYKAAAAIADKGPDSETLHGLKFQCAWKAMFTRRISPGRLERRS